MVGTRLFFRNCCTLLVCTLVTMTLGMPSVARAQDATATVLAERAELDKALGADNASRIPLLEKFLTDHPQSLLGDQAREALVRSHATVGEAALKNGDAKSASAAFTQALHSAGDKISDRLFQQVIWQMPVVMASAGFRFDAIELMKSFEPTFNDQAPRLIQIGYFYVSIESPLDAVRVLQHAVEIAPNDHRAHNTLGTAYVMALRLDDAATEFQKAIDLEPKEEYAYGALANLRRAFGNANEAIELYKKQLDTKPDDPGTYGGLAVAYLLNDDDPSAAGALAKALALQPGDFRLYTTLAYYYASRGKLDKAKEMVDLSMRYEPRFAWTHLVLGNILLGQRRYTEAITALSQAQGYGDFPTLHFELAKAYMVNDQFSQAIDQLNASFDITDDGQFETRLGDVLDLRSSKLDLLLDRERQAVLYMPIQPTTETQYRLAESLARIGHFLELVPDPNATAFDAIERRPLAPFVARVTYQEPAGRVVRTDPQVRPADAPLVYRARKTETAPATAAPAPAEPGPATPAPLEPSTGGTASPPSGDATVAPSTADVPATSVSPAPAPIAAAKPDPNGRAIDPALREQLGAAIDAFVGVDDGREAFRKMFVARQLAEKGVMLDRAKELAQQALDGADGATELERSVRDLPDADRETRKAVLTARAEDTLGWVLLKRGETDEAISRLTKASDGAVTDPDLQTRIWHLAVAKQEAGSDQEALDLYLRAYDPGSPSAPVRKQIIEQLYVKIHGSTDGLDQRLTRP